MRTSISHFISFITMVVISVFICFIFIEISFRDRIIIRNLDSINYYQDAYDNIILKIEQNIINEDIKEDYKDYITLEIIKKDIKSIINRQYKVSHYNDFYNIISKYTTDTDISKKYAIMVDDIYANNIFPISEYKIINRVYIKTRNCLIYSLVFLSIIMILELALYIINNNLKYNKITILSSSILLIFPFIFLNISQTFRHFVYTNSYYTNFFVKIINNIVNSLFIIGLIIVLVIFVLKLSNKKSKK